MLASDVGLSHCETGKQDRLFRREHHGDEDHAFQGCDEETLPIEAPHHQKTVDEEDGSERIFEEGPPWNQWSEYEARREPECAEVEAHDQMLDEVRLGRSVQ